MDFNLERGTFVDVRLKPTASLEFDDMPSGGYFFMRWKDDKRDGELIKPEPRRHVVGHFVQDSRAEERFFLLPYFNRDKKECPDKNFSGGVLIYKNCVENIRIIE